MPSTTEIPVSVTVRYFAKKPLAGRALVWRYVLIAAVVIGGMLWYLTSPVTGSLHMLFAIWLLIDTGDRED